MTKYYNFSSPHKFNFDNGEELQGVSFEASKLLSLQTVETVTINPSTGFEDIRLEFLLSDIVEAEISRYMEMYEINKDMVVIVPFPMLGVLKQKYGGSIIDTPFRVVRIKDRVTKIAYSNKFCI